MKLTHDSQRDALDSHCPLWEDGGFEGIEVGVGFPFGDEASRSIWETLCPEQPYSSGDMTAQNALSGGTRGVSTVDPQELSVLGGFGPGAPEMSFSVQPNQWDLDFHNIFPDAVSDAIYPGESGHNNPTVAHSLEFPGVYSDHSPSFPAGASMPGAAVFPVAHRQVSHVSDV
jgi:hypothetical protein